MSSKALLVTRDRELLVQFTKAIADVPMNWVFLDDRDLPFKLISHERFDLLVIDCTCGLGQTTLLLARQCAANHSTVIIAISDAEDMPQLLKLGADEYLERSAENGMLAQRIHELLPLVNHERRGPRCLLNVAVRVRSSKGESSATALLLSRGGMMLKLEKPLEAFEVIATTFTLPGSGRQTQAYCKIVWEGPGGLVGVRFLGLAESEKAELSTWISQRTDVLEAG